jgi:CheY-like chemotaxis protein
MAEPLSQCNEPSIQSLQRRIERLTEANRKKDELLAAVAHKLRTPLGCIRMTTEVLRMREGAKDLGDTIDRQVDDLASIISGMLSPGPADGFESEREVEPLAGRVVGIPLGKVANGSPLASFKSVQTPQRVLAVDDNPDAAEALADILRIWGHDVRVAHDAVEALQAGEEMHPHMMMLDLSLPNISGFQLARRVRKLKWGANIKLVAVSGWDREDDRLRARKAGFDYHLRKPVDFESLRTVFASLESNGTSTKPLGRT